MFNISVLQEPETLEAAVEMLHANAGLRIVAGGTDVLIRLQHGGEGWSQLLSLRNIKAPGQHRACATTEPSSSAPPRPSAGSSSDPIIRRHLPSLAEAAVSMGGPQIRNVATIGGNICNGAVSGDSASTLFALDALLRLESVEGERIIPIHEFYAGPGKVHLRPGRTAHRHPHPPLQLPGHRRPLHQVRHAQGHGHRHPGRLGDLPGARTASSRTCASAWASPPPCRSAAPRPKPTPRGARSPWPLHGDRPAGGEGHQGPDLLARIQGLPGAPG